MPDRPLNYITATSPDGAKVIDLKRNNIVGTGDFNPKNLYGGSANLLKDGQGYYTITHRYFHGDRGRRTYQNFIVRYDDNLRPSSISSPFKFCCAGIEFVTSVVELPDNEILVCVTEMDDLPEVHIYDKDEFFHYVQGVNNETR